MSLIVLLSMSAGASTDGDVARGWYLWRTGQDAEAVTVAREALEADPRSYAANELAIAMEVDQGNGPSVEARYRHAFGLQPDSAFERITLASVVARRNAEEGRWCDEVMALLRPVLDGEDRYWATRTERIYELRCKGTTDHADAELRRIAKEGGVGWQDGILAKLGAGYMKPEMPDEVERLWTEDPHLLDRAYLLWEDGVAGPAKMKIRSVTNKALKAAVEGNDASLVHAALVTYSKSERDKRADEARERLRGLDPDADLTLERSSAEIADPPIYGEIDACNGEIGPFKVLDCLEDIEGVPETGAIAAYYQSKLRLGYHAAKRPEDGLAAGRAAFQAERTHRYNARMFATDLLQAEGEPTEADLALSVEAVDVAFADRIPEDPAAVEGERTRRMLANDLDLWCQVNQLAGNSEKALPIQLSALLLEDTPRRRLRLGGILLDAGRVDDAVLQLVHGIHYEQDDTQAITEARTLLGQVAGSWNPRGLPGMLREVSWAPGQRPKSHPLVGRRLPALDAFGAPEVTVAEGEEPPVVRARAILTWAPFAPESNKALERFEGLSETYAEKGVVMQTVDVGLHATEREQSEGALPNTFGGAAVMRALRAVAPPTVVVVDGRDRVRGVLAAWHWNTLDLETLLDEVVPD